MLKKKESILEIIAEECIYIGIPLFMASITIACFITIFGTN